jgi:hypothetical protein
MLPKFLFLKVLSGLKFRSGTNGKDQASPDVK